MGNQNFKPDFLILPFQVAIHPSLQPADKILYGVIYWFQHLKEGKCTASNETLARVINSKNPRSISNSLNRLEEAGCIIRCYKDKEKNIRSHIKTAYSFRGTPEIDLVRVHQGVHQTMGGGSVDNEQISNTIKSNNTTAFSKKNAEEEDIEIIPEDEPYLPLKSKYRERILREEGKLDKSKYGEKYGDLIEWAQKLQGYKFVNRPKQLSALKKMRIAEISPSEIKERFREMHDKGWNVDFTSVASSFDKKR